jgi:hypothetical protein
MAMFDGHGGPELVFDWLIQANFSSNNIATHFERAFRKYTLEAVEALETKNPFEAALCEAYDSL